MSRCRHATIAPTPDKAADEGADLESLNRAAAGAGVVGRATGRKLIERHQPVGTLACAYVR